MNAYQENKEKARQKAIEWQARFNNKDLSYGELLYFQDYFKRLAKRYGLVEEFRENGII